MTAAICLSVWNNNALYWCFRSIVWIFVLIKALLTFCCIAKKEKFFSLHLIFLWSTSIKDILPEIELLSRILSPRYILQVLLLFEIHCHHGNYWLQRTHVLITFFKTLVKISNERDTNFDEKKCHDNKQQDNKQKKKRVVYYFKCHEDFCDIWTWTALAQEATTILLCDICLDLATHSENLLHVQYHSLPATSNLLLER